jgi:hypothetical protein
MLVSSDGQRSASSPDDLRVAIRLKDLLASFRRHLRAAAKPPRTIELYSQSVRYFSRRPTDRGASRCSTS